MRALAEKKKSDVNRQWAIDVAVAVVAKIYEVSAITRRWLHLSTAAGEAFSCGAAPQARRVPKAFLQPLEPCGEKSDSAAPPGFQKDFLRILLAFQAIVSLTGGLELIFFGRAPQPCKTFTIYFWTPRRIIHTGLSSGKWPVAASTETVSRTGVLCSKVVTTIFLKSLCWEKVGFAKIIPFSIPSPGVCLGRPPLGIGLFRANPAPIAAAPPPPPLATLTSFLFSPSPVTLTSHPHHTLTTLTTLTIGPTGIVCLLLNHPHELDFEVLVPLFRLAKQTPPEHPLVGPSHFLEPPLLAIFHKHVVQCRIHHHP